MDSSTATEQELVGKLTGTRRTFVTGVAAAGASTAVAYALDSTGVSHLFADDALAAKVNDPTPFSRFEAIAASSLDEFQVPPSFRADVLIAYGDEFSDGATTWRYGYNNDYLAFFPLEGKTDEGLIFVNHEYPDPFFLHGYKTSAFGEGSDDPSTGKHTKSAADIALEKEMVGNSIVHIKRGADGVWSVVSPSKYNRRVFGGTVPGKAATPLTFTGPLAAPGSPGSTALHDPVRIGTSAEGTVGNCSGGITPWDTALSCEENYDGYGFDLGARDFDYGWGSEYEAETGAPDEKWKYGWVCEHDPYDPAFVGRKHTALGRFRHENTAFRQAPGKRFVLYMGDDQANQAIYKFVSTRAFVPGNRSENLKILTEGTLYVAKWLPEGRRRFTSGADVTPVAGTGGPGTGEWRKIDPTDLFDTRLRLGGFKTQVSSSGNRFPAQNSAGGVSDPASPSFSGRYNRRVDPETREPLPAGTAGGVNEWDTYFATNRPEDVEVDEDGTVYIALTNNSSVNDTHGSIRRLRETGNDPEAKTFTWEDFSAGGPSFDPARGAGTRGFSSPDNLVFDKGRNVWVVTDISSASLNRANNYNYHGNNAVFMIPREGPNQGIAFRFANMPIEAEGTGPYFTPDEQTLFINVQHPGEETKNSSASKRSDPSTFTSWWPESAKTRAGATPKEPLPATVVITRVQKETGGDGGGKQPGNATIPPKAEPPKPTGEVPLAPPPPAAADRARPRFDLEEIDSVESLRALLGSGWTCEIAVDEPSRMTLMLQVTLPRGRRRRRGGAKSASAEAEAAQTRTLTIARLTRDFPRPGKYTLKVRPGATRRAQLRGLSRVSARLFVSVRDRSGNTSRQTRRISFRR